MKKLIHFLEIIFYVLIIESGSVLASVFLKENEYFQTEPALYIKKKIEKLIH